MFANSSQILADYEILKSGEHSRKDCIRLMKKAIIVVECAKLVKSKIPIDQNHKLDCVSVYQTKIADIISDLAEMIKNPTM